MIEGDREWWRLVLTRALDRLDPEESWRRGRQVPHTRAEVELQRTVEALLRELRGATK